LKPVNPSIATTSTPSRQACGRSASQGLERLLAAAFNHVQQPCRASPVPDAGQVDDDGDVLVAPAGVPPHVLIDAENPDPVEPRRVSDQDPASLGQDRVVRRVPRHAKSFGDAGDGQVLTDDRLQRPT
jgi:hypothetical protein